MLLNLPVKCSRHDDCIVIIAVISPLINNVRRFKMSIIMWAFPTNDVLKRPVNNAERNASISAAFMLLQAKICYLERTNLAVFNLACNYQQTSAHIRHFHFVFCPTQL